MEGRRSNWVRNTMVGISFYGVRRGDIREKLESFWQDSPHLPCIYHSKRIEQFSSLVADIANSFISISETGRGTSAWEKESSGNACFDPIAMAFTYNLRGDIDEACWLLFLLSYFGRHPRHEWRLLEKIYFGFGKRAQWTWEYASSDPSAFASWLMEYQYDLYRSGNLGNAHKFVSFDNHKAMKTADHIIGYISWVKSAKGHRQLLSDAVSSVDGLPSLIFNMLYTAINSQLRFKKAITFEYLSLLGIIGMINIEPGRPYLSDHLFSKLGANWLFDATAGSKLRTSELETIVTKLAQHMELPFCIPVLRQAFTSVAGKSHAESIQRFKWRYKR